MKNDECLKNLQEAVCRLHECSCSHLESTRVIEHFQGEKIWEGDIETFSLIDHPNANEAFAWIFDNGKEPQYIAILRLHPINTPQDALKAAIASGAFR